MGGTFPPQGSGDDVGAANIAEAKRLWEQYQREQATRPADPATAQGGAQSLFERAFQAAGEPLGKIFGGAMHVAGAPGRALDAYATNQAGTQGPVDISDAAIYGQDMETGRQSASYGDLLAGTLADSGEITPGGKAAAIIKFAGNVITDPAAAPLLLSGAEGAGALAGRMGPSAAAGGPRGPRIPSGKMYPQYGDIPQAPFDPGATQRVPIRPPQPSRVSPFPRAGIEAKVVKGTRPGGPEGPPSPMANQTQAVKTIKPQGKSIESKFAAKKAEMRAGHGETGIESKMKKTEAPKEATFKKGEGRSWREPVAKPRNPTAREHAKSQKAKPKPKASQEAKDTSRKTASERAKGEGVDWRIVDGRHQYGHWSKLPDGSEMWVKQRP